MTNTNELRKIKELACKAGNSIMNIYHTNFTVEHKADQSPLTMADQQANEIIVEGLKKEFSEVAILSEESRDDRSRLEEEYCFIVDPLDGTKEFINRNGQFTVNIGLVKHQRVVMGVVYVPVTQTLYYAAKGEGAFKENLQTGEKTRLMVSDRLEELVWVGSRSHSSEREAALIEEKQHLITETMSAGSSLKGCMVAEGKADVYYRFGLTSEWDTAAMQCVVEEAGGIFRQMDGSEMLYNRENSLNEKGFFVVNRKENIWV
ncbi:3'(2'),5'-bisphosphate nucleotidase [Tindallia magadiensis]|uniref:3'(2'),5'-bisphosphate nucleotidase CysQ n=1 Tax=Tindallia magadiensis TaxID=69895 RepID=A0A1I3D3Y4_9FIRM|nr:3'(2'),5'-bisphosphate nucleotidase CysQ [Tindallia magadiensis]SFH81407.1 3'(2'),5'-bisphosphate nucleotidase [Tindallia magadiensis]